MNAKTMFTKTALTAGAVGVLATAGVAGATAASASTTKYQPPREAAGSVELGNPLQYEQFVALTSRWHHSHGVVDYTNWTYAEPGSRVYAPAGEVPGGVTSPIALVFTYQGHSYPHTLNGGLKLTALSPDTLAFSGSGFYNGSSTTWKIHGQVTDGRFRATIAYDGSSYKVFLTGKIATDGSLSGKAESSSHQALTFTMPAGSFKSVLHYITPVQSAKVQRHNATFQFTIPASAASSGLAGVKVTVTVHDGGWGARHDTYAANGTSYPIIGGPGITVHA
jgi:hypothetical protein